MYLIKCKDNYSIIILIKKFESQRKRPLAVIFILFQIFAHFENIKMYVILAIFNINIKTLLSNYNYLLIPIFSCTHNHDLRRST